MPDDFLPPRRSGYLKDDDDEEAKEARFDLDVFLNESLRKRHKVPHLNEVIEHLINSWGGASNFAGAFYKEFCRLPPGMVRARMMESVLRLLQTHANLSGAPEDLGMISEDDLKAAALSLFHAKKKEAGTKAGSDEGLEAKPGQSEEVAGSKDS